jgi:hypothetical protein
MQIQKLEVLLKSGLMPRIYVKMSYKFLVGCLWIRFAPLFNDVYNGVSAAIRMADENLQEELCSNHSRMLLCLS